MRNSHWKTKDVRTTAASLWDFISAACCFVFYIKGKKEQTECLCLVYFIHVSHWAQTEEKTEKRVIRVFFFWFPCLVSKCEELEKWKVRSGRHCVQEKTLSLRVGQAGGDRRSEFGGSGRPTRIPIITRTGWVNRGRDTAARGPFTMWHWPDANPHHAAFGSWLDSCCTVSLSGVFMRRFLLQPPEKFLKSWWEPWGNVLMRGAF